MANIGKLNEKSDLLRSEGNQLYALRNFHDALIKYNESLCTAENESENVGLAYANRSALYFEMKLYELCLRNIDSALVNKYPKKNLEILINRQNRCSNALTSKENTTKVNVDPLNIFETSVKRSSQFLDIGECLKLRVDGNFGRHIVTDAPLNVGDIIVNEKPFCKVLHEEFIYQRCGWCFKDNFMSLIPCVNCTKEMYCSDDCRTKAADSFHVYECPVIDLITSSLLTSTMRIALRTFFYGLSIFGGSIEDFAASMNKHQGNLTIFDAAAESDEIRKLYAVHSLTSECKISVNDLIFEEIFQTSSNLKDLWTSHSDFIRNFLIKQTKIATMNYHEIYNWPLKNHENSDTTFAYKRGVVEVGNGSFPFCSLLNHSCTANVSRVFRDDTIILIVQRPISKGEQIFDNYGFNFTNVPKDQRQSELIRQYNFLCQCIACEKNYPLLPSLSVADKTVLNRAKKFCRELSLAASINPKKAQEKYKEIMQVLRLSMKHKKFPTVEICSLLESFFAFSELMMRPKIQF